MASFLSYLFGGSTDQNAAGKAIGEKEAPLMQDADHPGVTAFHKLVRDSTMAGFNKTGKEALRMASKAKRSGAVNQFSLSTEVMETEEARTSIAKHVKEIITKAEQNAGDMTDYELLADAFVLCAHKRGTTRGKSGNGKGVAGGEGERLIYYQMVLELYKYYPETTVNLIALSPEFGYWLDLYQIWALLCWRLENSYEMLSGPGYNYNKLVLAIIRIIYDQLVKDLATPDSEASAMPSQLIKWFAREGSYYDKHCYLPGVTNQRVTSATIFARLVGHYYFDKAKMPAMDVDYVGHVLVDRFAPSVHFLNKYRRLLRKRVADLNRKAKTFETFACAKNWSSINPESVPSRCMLKYTKAYLNESLKGTVPLAQEDTGNRYPENPDRVQARKNLLDMLTEPSKIKTAGIDPHEIMKAFVKNESVAQSKVAMAQWTQKVAEVMAQLAEKRAELVAVGWDIPSTLNSKPTLDGRELSGMAVPLAWDCNPMPTVPAHVGKLIPMMDVSGSMSGLPMEVSIGLGIFLTYIQEAQGQEPIAISFNEAPRVFNFKDMTLRERYDHVNANVGLTTNFESALDLVLDCIANSGEHRDLIVFTDGQFDQMNIAGGSRKSVISWTTSHERFLQKVAERGLDRAPRIIYWNLRANTPGVQTSAKHPGVQMLQGYSPALLRFVLLGDNVPDKEVEVLNTITGKVAKVKVAGTTPYDTYRSALDVERWDIVRAMLDESTEKYLAGYNWIKIIPGDMDSSEIRI